MFLCANVTHATRGAPPYFTTLPSAGSTTSNGKVSKPSSAMTSESVSRTCRVKPRGLVKITTGADITAHALLLLCHSWHHSVPALAPDASHRTP